MKNSAGVIILVVLTALVFSLAGCGPIHGQGETADEGHRRHMRQLKLEKDMLIDDVDAVLHTDRPTRLSRKTIR